MKKTRKKKTIPPPESPAFNLADYGLAPNSKFNPKYIEDGQRLATVGMSHKSMAWYWGVNEDTITLWKERVPQFSDALKKGEAERNLRLLSALFTSAIEQHNIAAMIFLAKNWLEMRDNVDQSLSTIKPLKIEILPADARKK